MPRTLHPDLRDCLERANPYVEYRIEISEPDVGQVLRRQDQFTQAPSLVSLSPANSLSASARGSLILTPSTVALATYAGVGGSYDLNAADTPDRRYKGLSWTIDSAFSRATLKSILAKVQAVTLAGFFFDQEFECQIYRITKTPGVKVKNVGASNYSETAFTDYSFAPLLNPAPKVKVTASQWGAASTQTLNFDLSNFALILENTPTRAVTPDQTGELPKYLVVIRLTGKGLGGTGHYRWRTDTVASHTVAGVGTFERVFWAKDSDEAQWVEQTFADVPNITINIEAYPASGQGIYLIDQGAVPRAAANGRIEFQRALPPGTNATVELSTAGSGGPWTVVKHGDEVAVKQQTYHLRTTLTPDAALHATPEVIAQGVEFRIPRDVSVEGTPILPTREISLPWPKASIPEGKLRVVRTGIRDYLDIGSAIASTSATSRLEVDIFLASRHPSITRDKWHRLERMMVTNRLPSATSEEFTLLSYASRLKRKIPQKAETLNSVHVVASSTTGQVVLGSVLPGTTVGGNEYDGKNYYMRVRATAAANIPVGYVQTIQGSTDTTKLDFTPALPQALVAGDVIEVHSAIFQTVAVSWTDYDPADVWWEVLTNLLAIPPERVGIGSLPRGGKPPKVIDIAPGDATTQAKRKVTGRISEETEGDKVIDSLSAILGGVTLEIDGQIVFVQIIPLVDLAGNVTVPLPPPAAIFDIRDFAAPPQTPPGIEQRSTIVSAKYGVPATAATPESFPSKATTSVDSDALLWLQQQDLEEYGTADVPDEIAAWFYNTTDDGLYLASAVPAGLVKVASTGLRVWPLSMAEKHPHLVPGDVIVIAIDSYTDYDPSTQTPIKGPIAVRGVLVRVGNEGRQLSMFVPGLRDNVQQIAGMNIGGLPGLVPELRVLNFREIERSVTEITLGWSVEGAVQELWLYLSTQALPVSGDPWAGLTGAPTVRLTGATTTYTVPIPEVGTITYGRLVPVSANLERGRTWDFTLQGAAEGPKYTSAIARITASDATTVTVTVEGLASVGTPTVQFVEVLGSATKASGPNVGVASPSGTVWVFNRGVINGGVGQARFRSVLAGYENDDDLVTIEEQGRDTVPLIARARVTASTPTTLTVRVAVADPYPQGANTATIIYTETGGTGGAAATPASGGTATPAATLTEVAGSYIDYTVTRPDFGTGTRRITFTATAANRTTDSDAVDVPAVEQDTNTTYTECRATVTAVSATQVTVTVSGVVVSGTPTVGYVAVTGSAALASGHAAGTYTHAVNGTDNVWVFNRGAFQSGVGQAQFRAITAGAQSDDDFVEIPEQGRDTVFLAMRARVTATDATTLTVRVAVADPYPQGANSVTIIYDPMGLGAATSPASGGTATPVATLTEAAGTYIDYTVTRPTYGAGTGRITFTATAANRTSDSDAVDVPENTTTTVPAGVQTKTMRIPHAAFAPSLNTTVYERLPHKTSPNSNASVEFYAPVVLPIGVTIIAFRAHWYLLDSGTNPNHGTLGSSLLRLTAGGGNNTVAGLSATKGAGVTYVTDASGTLSELTSSGRHYVVIMGGGSETNGGTHGGGSIGFSWVEIDYTMSSYDQSL